VRVLLPRNAQHGQNEEFPEIREFKVRGPDGGAAEEQQSQSSDESAEGDDGERGELGAEVFGKRISAAPHRCGEDDLEVKPAGSIFFLGHPA
jgi:hypothetical protein